jgi:SsrA-binding protein
MAKTKQAAGRAGNDEVRVLVRNRRALHDYEISDRLEAGMVLVGSEVKSLRESKASLAQGYVEIRGGEAWLVGAQINEYPWANQFNHDPVRPRKLLLHRDELARLDIKVSQRGFTIVPLSIYLKGGRIKLELGVGRGKKQFEKRESKKAAEATREIEQEIRRRR